MRKLNTGVVFCHTGFDDQVRIGLEREIIVKEYRESENSEKKLAYPSSISCIDMLKV